jgi:hypothetical protein
MNVLPHIQENLATEGIIRVDTDSRFIEAKEVTKESSHCSYPVGDSSACRLWIRESRLCRSMTRCVSKAWPHVQVKSKARESTEDGIVPGTGPEAGWIGVGGECGTMNGTEPGVLPLDIDEDPGFPT